MCDATAIFAMAAGNMLLARSEYKSTKAFAEAEAQQQREQVEDERLQLAIESLETQNSLAQIFQEDVAANRALLASYGITESSGSYQALLARNVDRQKQDLRNTNLSASLKARDLSYQASDIERNLLASKTNAKNNFIGSLLSTGMTASTALEGMKKSPPKTTTPTSRNPYYAQRGFTSGGFEDYKG